ncbi:MAG: hypothetical protein VCA18_01770 [Opitutales bacterium]
MFIHFLLKFLVVLQRNLDFFVNRFRIDLSYHDSRNHQGEDSQNACKDAEEGEKRDLQVVVFFLLQGYDPINVI